MMKRSRSSLSSSPFPYDDYDGSYDDASVIYYDSSDPSSSQSFQGDGLFSSNPPSFDATQPLATLPPRRPSLEHLVRTRARSRRGATVPFSGSPTDPS